MTDDRHLTDDVILPMTSFLSRLSFDMLKIFLIRHGPVNQLFLQLVNTIRPPVQDQLPELLNVRRYNGEHYQRTIVDSFFLRLTDFLRVFSIQNPNDGARKKCNCSRAPSLAKCVDESVLVHTVTIWLKIFDFNIDPELH